MSADRAPSLLHRLWLRAFATAGVVAAVLLSWWWRIEDARAPETIPAASFGQAIDLGRTVVTPQAFEWQPGDGRLVLTALAENVTGETQPFTFGIFGGSLHPPQLVLDGTGQDPADVLLLRDRQPLQQLQPRLPEKIALIWQAPPGWQPQTVEIDFSRQAFALIDNFYRQSSWLGYSPAARLTALPKTVR